MKPFKGTTIVESGCLKSDNNTFYVKLDDGRTVTMRQPRRRDSSKLRKAWKQVSATSRRLYTREYVDKNLYNMNKRCNMPLYRGEFPGVLTLILEADDTVIGFCDIFFKYGSYFPRFKVDDTEKCANGSITALDKYRGLGVGNMYAALSNIIAKHFGCQWILGRTKKRGGMRGIRRTEGWIVTGYYGEWVDHKLRL